MAQQCQVHFLDYNRNRALSGSGMDLECPGELSSPPFGTWAVDSVHNGECVNCGQFSGWKDAEGWPDAWNSCNYGDYAPPNPFYYNVNWVAQATTFGDNLYANYWSDPLPWPCSDYGDIYTLSNYFMKLWETDDFPFNPDDEAGVLSYPTFNVVLSCNGTICSGQSGWIDPSPSNGWSRTSSGPDSATAQISTVVELYDE
jgi:hypothetical protein